MVKDGRDVDGESTAGKVYWVCCKKKVPPRQGADGRPCEKATWRYRLKKSWNGDSLGGDDKWWLEREIKIAGGEQDYAQEEKNCCDLG